MAKVIVAETQAERQEIYRFRYQVYVEEMQKRPSCANHQTKTITDKLDKIATLLYVMQNERGVQLFFSSVVKLAGETEFLVHSGNALDHVESDVVDLVSVDAFLTQPAPLATVHKILSITL